MSPELPELTARQRSAWNRIAILLLTIGVVLQVANWAVDRSLNNEEVSVALNLKARGWKELAKPLDLAQVAPVGFLWLVKGVSQVFGDGERSLRLVPLLAGLVSLPLAFYWLRRWMSPLGTTAALALLVVQPLLIFFAGDLKPYSTDVAAVLCILLLDLRAREANFRGWRLVPYALAGLLAPWLSFPVVFALAAVAVSAGVRMLRGRRWRALFAMSGLWILWAASAALHFSLIHTTVNSSFLQDFWERAFPPWGTGLGRILLWPLTAWVELFRQAIKGTQEHMAALIATIGVLLLAVRHGSPARTALLILPVALAAAAAHVYPFGSRLALYLLPLLCSALAAALVALFAVKQPLARVVAILLFVALMADPVARSAKNLVAPSHREESRPVLKELAVRASPTDHVYVYGISQRAFLYYAPRCGLNLPFLIGTRPALGQESPTLEKEPQLKEMLERGRVWVFFAHSLREQRERFLAGLRANANEVDCITATGSGAYLFERR